MKAMQAYEKHMHELQSFKVEVVEDTSELGIFTEYESHLLLRNVHLDEYESRLKQFVYKVAQDQRKSLPQEVCTIKLKQLQIAFAGNEYLEKILTDKNCLDWRLLMQENIFVYF